ncbi:MAG: hypothetical protein GX923_00940 [Clostridia bacterium]|jgi:hypothetical protein|nr:hypothetical protein [Clostridia bacterium]
MLAIIAGTLAALGAWGLNCLLVKRWGDRAVSVLVPVVEEVLKTLLAFSFNSLIILSHFTFGIIEAIWDIKTCERGLKPGLIGIITHIGFGLITILVWELTGFLSLAILASILAHITWNSIIIKKANKI